jgi:hypothetical protein
LSHLKKVPALIFPAALILPVAIDIPFDMTQAFLDGEFGCLILPLVAILRDGIFLYVPTYFCREVYPVIIA